MEVQTVSFGYVRTPLKEDTPRRIRNALAEVFILNHIGDRQVLCNQDVVFLMMKKFVDEFTDEVFAFISSSLMVQSEFVLVFLPMLTPFFLSRKVFRVFSEQTFCLAIPSEGYLPFHLQKSLGSGLCRHQPQSHRSVQLSGYRGVHR